MSESALTKDKIKDIIPHFSSLKNVFSKRYSELKRDEDNPIKRLISNESNISESEVDKRPLFSSFKRRFLSKFGKQNRINPIEDTKTLEEEQLEKIKQEQKELQILRAKYCEKSLNHFTIENKFRRLCIYILNKRGFENLIIFFIACNSIILGLNDYTWDRKQLEIQSEMPFMNQLNEKSEIFFTTVFTLEACIKIMSLGFIFSKNSYLRDPWNWLDFMVVVTGLAQKLPSMQNMSMLRTFRLFRPLKTLSNVPSMKLMVTTLFNSFSLLSNILILDMLFIFIFAIFGHAMWEGVLSYRCRQTKFPVNKDWKVVESDHRICGAFHQCEVACGSLYNLKLLGDDGIYRRYFLDESIALNRDSISIFQNFGITNFDEIKSAYLTIFQCTTLEGWSKIMEMIEDGYNLHVSALFFILCVVVCSFFLLNLTIAVMLDKFNRVKKRTQKILALKDHEKGMEKDSKCLNQYMI